MPLTSQDGRDGGKAPEKRQRSTRNAEKIMEKLMAVIKKNELDVEKCSLSRQALNTLRKKGELRTDLEIETICRELLSQVWCDKLPETVRYNKVAFRDVVRVMRAVKYNTPEVPIEDEGFPMENFYAVLSGSCWTEVPAESKPGSDEVNHGTNIKKYLPGDVLGENFWQEGAVWGNTFNVSPGGAELLVISRSQFDETMRPHMMAVMRDRALFLKSVYVFRHFDMEACMNLVSIMKFKTYPCNTTIIRQGDIPHDIFVIVRGHCRVLKDLLMSANDLVLRKPVQPSFLSKQSSSPFHFDAKRRPVVGKSVPPSDFRFEIYRQDSPPHSRVPRIPSPNHPDHLVVRTADKGQTPRVTPRSPNTTPHQHASFQSSPSRRPSDTAQSHSRDFLRPHTAGGHARARSPHGSAHKYLSMSPLKRPSSASQAYSGSEPIGTRMLGAPKSARVTPQNKRGSPHSARGTPHDARGILHDSPDAGENTAGTPYSKLKHLQSPPSRASAQALASPDSDLLEIASSGGSGGSDRDEREEWGNTTAVNTDKIRPYTSTPNHRQLAAGDFEPTPISQVPRLRMSSEKKKPTGKNTSMSQGLVYDVGHADERGNRRVIVELRELWPGEMFGELGTVTKTVRSASVVTMSQVDCLVLSKIDCFRLGYDTGDVADRMAKMGERMKYVYDNDDIRRMILKEFRWSNFKQDLTTDTVFGSNFIKPDAIPDFD